MLFENGEKAMVAFLMALIVAGLGSLPLLAGRKFGAAAITSAVYFVALWPIFYAACPSLVWPLGGLLSVFLLLCWAVSAIIGSIIEGKRRWTWLFTVALLVIMVFRAGSGCGCFRASEYSKLIGDFEEKEWTQDVQPASAEHIRLVPWELACFLADKQLGQVAGGAIGSQFSIDRGRAAIQRIKGEFWWVVPLDYNGFTVWTSVDYAPGYVLVHADDPNVPPIVKSTEKFRFTPGAYFADNLERHLWSNGYLAKGLGDAFLEIDETGKAWWVVVVFKPTIAYSGSKMTGVAIVDPENGDITFYESDKIPEWVDRAVPDHFVRSYINLWGSLRGGWVNSWWGKKDLIEAEPSEFIFGTDGEPYFVTRITSTATGDEAVVGMFYTNSRTGKTVKYHTIGATDASILKVVEGLVGFKNWYGVSPTIYNIYGVMTSVVPILSQSHVFQGVALVNVENQQPVIAGNLTNALRDYQRLLAGAGNQMAPETAHNLTEMVGVVERFAAEVKGGETVYYLKLVDQPRLFTGDSSNLAAPKLPLTKEGDEVIVNYINSGEDVVPMMRFDNKNLQLQTTAVQEAVREAGAERLEVVDVQKDARDARSAINQMTDEEVRDLMQQRRQTEEPASAGTPSGE